MYKIYDPIARCNVYQPTKPDTHKAVHLKTNKQCPSKVIYSYLKKVQLFWNNSIILPLEDC